MINNSAKKRILYHLLSHNLPTPLSMIRKFFSFAVNHSGGRNQYSSANCTGRYVFVNNVLQVLAWF